jgi:hypothetical protein
MDTSKAEELLKWLKEDVDAAFPVPLFQPLLAYAIAATKALRVKQVCEHFGPAEECSDVLEIETALDEYCPRCLVLAAWPKLFGEEAHE